MNNTFSESTLAGQVIIVTGAARGVGAAIASQLHACGATVILADINTELGSAQASEVGERAQFLPLDVTQETQWASLVETVNKEHGRIDALVNNAAILHMGTIESSPGELFTRLHAVNTLGPYLGMQAVLPSMKRAGSGSIVNIGSVDALQGTNSLTAYIASKWGLRGLSKAAAMEVGRDGIRVNTLCAAGGNPEMFSPWIEKMLTMQDDLAALSTGRAMEGEVPLEGIADAVIFLCSNASRHITGIDLPVDHGETAGHHFPGFNTITNK